MFFQHLADPEMCSSRKKTMVEPFMTLAEDLEKQFRAGLRERDIAEFFDGGELEAGRCPGTWRGTFCDRDRFLGPNVPARALQC
jgi:hypothetical protein